MTVNRHLEAVDIALARGDLIGAAMMLDARGAAESKDPHELVLLARVLTLRGRHQQAMTMLARALEQDAHHVEALVERARYAVAAGERSAASEWFGRAWQTGSRSESWVVEWVQLLVQLGDPVRASEIAHAHCACVPQNSEAWFWLGYAQQVTRQFGPARVSYEHCARLNPNRPMLANNIAALCLEQDDVAHARHLLEQVVAHDPANAMAWTNYATALRKQGELVAAQIAVERALAIEPDYPVALQAQVNVLKEMQAWDLAYALAQRAYELAPGDANAWNLAMLQLMRGDYENGWRHHEARWQGSRELREHRHELPMPLWEGQSLKGKTLVVWGEQGHGDVLQFVRFVPLLAERVKRDGGTLVYCTYPGLQSLLRRSLTGIVVPVVATGDPSTHPAGDWHVPLASLPMRLGVRLKDLPMRQRYLTADAGGVEAWRERLVGSRGIKVGLVWSGSRTHQRNPMRSVNAVAYARAFSALKGVAFFSLQVAADADVQAMRNAGLQIADHTAEFATFDNTAAYLQNLDLVITVCTSVAHLAGGLGVPTWLLLDVNPHWTWMTGREDSPWYPSVKLYRQPAYGQWGPVLTRVAADLTNLIKRCQSTRPAMGKATPDKRSLHVSGIQWADQ
ncbi:tetratricopeptide repeat protein [Burkholderia ubonensis]|uniref:tetratricopeptide repeat protein n=1 Tax=Burkholderia ubonensis TaxID=101571 RepID=UPI000A8FF9A2|nr:tetratricopeptide repeat protein [Burkholderia ubonensis]